MPVAIFNGAREAEPIVYFLPSYLQAEQTNNNYQRLMDRLNAYQLANSVQALFYYQGEADTMSEINASSWSDNFGTLMDSWSASFPNLRNVYLTQIRGCTGRPYTSAVREQQRQLGNTSHRTLGVQVMSTTAMDGFDGGCHFFYEGYKQLGGWYATLLMHDFYGGSAANATAPAPQSIRKGANGTTLLIDLANKTDPMTVAGASKADFFITSRAGLVYQPTKVTASKGLITLTLPAGATAVSVSYRGEASKGTAFITNGAGIGLLAFEGLPVTQ